MRGRAAVSILIASLASTFGCGDKRKDDDDRHYLAPSPSPESSASKSEPLPGNKGNWLEELAKEKKKDRDRLSRPFNGVKVGEWSYVGDLRIGVYKAAVAKAIVVRQTFRGEKQEEQDDEVTLVVYFNVENLSKTKKFDYSRSSLNFHVTDDLGNDYRQKNSISFSSSELKGSLSSGFKSMYPAGPAIADAVQFERPVDAAKEVRIRFASPLKNEDREHQFLIMQSDWK